MCRFSFTTQLTLVRRPGMIMAIPISCAPIIWVGLSRVQNSGELLHCDWNVCVMLCFQD